MKSVKEISKKGKFVPEHFPVRYRQFLQQTQPQTPTYTENKKELFIGRMVLIKLHLLHLRNSIERMIASLIFTFCRTHLRLQTRRTPPKRLPPGNTMCGLD